MTEDTRLMSSLKKVKNIRQYVFSGRTPLFHGQINQTSRACEFFTEHTRW
jgi:hypothetical protein